MKNLKYLLFSFFICFIYLTPVLATERLMQCEYAKAYIDEEKTQYIKYRVTYYEDFSVTHEFVPSDSSNYKVGSSYHNNVGVFGNDGTRVSTMSYIQDKFTGASMNAYYDYGKGTCPYFVYKVSKSSVADRTITPGAVDLISFYKTDKIKEVVISSPTSSYVKPLNNSNSNSNNNNSNNNSGSNNNNQNNNGSNNNESNNNSENNNSNVVCVYETSYTAPYQYTITCKPNGSNNANCTIQDSYNQLSIAAGAVSFSIGSTCPSTIYTSSANNEITNINTTSGDALSLNKNKSTENNTTNPNGNGTVQDYENDSRYIQAKQDADKYCAPANTSSGYVDDTLCYNAIRTMEEIKDSYNSEPNQTGNNDDLDLDHFCQGPVQGVFTTLGWVFFIVKILIPLLLIVFGSIDVAKAIVASKDDEIKKSVRVLAIRAIAGVIIFFVPTILNFVVKIIDNSDVYNGTFWDCTKCMLDPTDESVCSTLRGN